MNAATLILASTSPYRRALLGRLGIAFEAIPPEVDESQLPNETAQGTALRLAEAKARAVAGAAAGRLIIGSDQVAETGGVRLGKPGSHEAAVQQLQFTRGKRVTFHTAVCLYNAASNHVQLANVPTTVTFRQITDDEIECYLRREKPYDCAGSAKIEGLGVALVESVVSEDPTALIGLPLVQLVTMLDNEGVRIV